MRVSSPSISFPVLCACALLGPGTLVLALIFGFDSVEADASQPEIHRQEGNAGSAACRSCHPDHWESWQRTYHASMTQRPNPRVVRGIFDGRSLEFAGKLSRVGQDGDGFWMDVPAESGATRRARVELVVGSHRYQQYFERIEVQADGGADEENGWVRRRLPFLWSIERGEWLNVNTVFFRADGSVGHSDDAVWNANCIFCHNTNPKPESLAPEKITPEDLGLFNSLSGELGIACEACHGPGAAHAQRMRSPLARLAQGHPDDIVAPSQLSARAQRDLCGQCHGQRIPPDLATARSWLVEGPSFRPGNTLTQHVIPIARDTPSPVASDPEQFAQRFWREGTARLSAYEWQGIEASRCIAGGELSCGSCHSMHSGSPSGMLRPDQEGDAACGTCHAEIAQASSAHSGHAAGSPGASCIACHMPPITYGVLSIHPSHHIDSPDPRRDGEAGRPHACTLCHLNRSLLWSARESSRIFGRPFDAPRQRPSTADLSLPDGIASLLTGDPLQRVVFAAAIGRQVKAAGGQVSAVAPSDRATLWAALIVTLGDAYPLVRRFALDSLKALDRDAGDLLGELLKDSDQLNTEARRERISTLLAALRKSAATHFNLPPTDSLLQPDFSLQLDRVVELLNLQSQTPISIGE